MALSETRAFPTILQSASESFLPRHVDNQGEESSQQSLLILTGSSMLPPSSVLSVLKEQIVWWFLSKAPGRALDLKRACRQLVHRIQ
jgi:hypothetical protein